MRLIFAGTSEFAARALTVLSNAEHEIALVLCQPDRPAGRGLRTVEGPVKRCALERRLDCYQPMTLKDDQAISRLAATNAQAMVVAAYGLILPQAVLDLVPLGAINIHASLLPRWRGAAPVQRALIAGDRETGVTIMKMDSGLDTGPLFTQQRLAIDADDDAGSLHEKLANLGAEMIVPALADLEHGSIAWRAQAEIGATYAHKITKQDTFIDWSLPAVELERRVRAFRPQPGAQTAYRGERVKLWRAAVCSSTSEAPGTVLEASARQLIVASGVDALSVTELQRPGGRRLPVAEFLHGLSLRPGDHFDPIPTPT